MTAQRQLDDAVYAKIDSLCESGNRKSDEGLHREALEDFERALALIPEPIEDWEAATWTLTALGDCCFLLGDYEAAHRHLSRALDCPDIPGSEFLILRLGQARYELGDEEGAKEALESARQLGGPKLFKDEDPKYLAFLSPGT